MSSEPGEGGIQKEMVDSSEDERASQGDHFHFRKRDFVLARRKRKREKNRKATHTPISGGGKSTSGFSGLHLPQVRKGKFPGRIHEKPRKSDGDEWKMCGPPRTAFCLFTGRGQRKIQGTDSPEKSFPHYPGLHSQKAVAIHSRGGGQSRLGDGILPLERGR